MNVNRSSSSIESARAVELAGMLRGPLAAARAQRVELVERRSRGPRSPRPWRAARRPRQARRPPPSGRGRTGRRAPSSRVDRRADRADEPEREVEQRPLEARPREERERVSLADAEREQPVRELVDRPCGVRTRDLPPLAVGLVEVGRVGVARGDRVPPKVRDRPGAPRCQTIAAGTHEVRAN